MAPTLVELLRELPPELPPEPEPSQSSPEAQEVAETVADVIVVAGSLLVVVSSSDVAAVDRELAEEEVQWSRSVPVPALGKHSRYEYVVSALSSPEPAVEKSHV